MNRAAYKELLRKMADGGEVERDPLAVSEEGVMTQGPQAQADYSKLLYDITADMTPGLGEARSAQRSGEAFDKAKQAFAAGDYFSALGFGSSSAAEALGTLPIIGMAARMPASLARMSPKVVDLFEGITAQKAAIRDQIAELGDPKNVRGEAKKQLQALQQQEQDLAMRSVYARGKAEEGVPEEEIIKILEEGAPGWDFGTKASRTTGQPASQIDTKEFKNWFGKSKVVDDSGQPLVVYKGMPSADWRTGEQITEIRSASGPWAGFFTSDKEVASKFAEAFGEGAITVPAYLSMKKPFVVDAKGGMARDFMFDASVLGKSDYLPARKALESGEYDGVIIKNTADEGDIYIPKGSTQVKSAIGNEGTFDPTTPVITKANGGEVTTDDFIREVLTEDQAVQDAERTRGQVLQDESAAQYWQNFKDALFNKDMDVKTNEDYRPDLIPVFQSAAVRALTGTTPTAGVDYEHYPRMPSGATARGSVSSSKARAAMTEEDRSSRVQDAARSIGGATLRQDADGNIYLIDVYDFNKPSGGIRDLYGAARHLAWGLDELGVLHNYRTELNLGNKYDLLKGLSKAEVDEALKRAGVKTFVPEGRKVHTPNPRGRNKARR